MKTREYIVLQDEDGFLHFGDELVRCKDCKEYKYCYLLPNDDDYCSKGERKEE